MEFRINYALELLRSGKIRMIQDECDNAFWIDGDGQICSDDCTSGEYSVVKMTDEEFLEKHSDSLFAEVG